MRWAPTARRWSCGASRDSAVAVDLFRRGAADVVAAGAGGDGALAVSALEQIRRRRSERERRQLELQVLHSERMASIGPPCGGRGPRDQQPRRLHRRQPAPDGRVRRRPGQGVAADGARDRGRSERGRRRAASGRPRPARRGSQGGCRLRAGGSGQGRSRVPGGLRPHPSHRARPARVRAPGRRRSRGHGPERLPRVHGQHGVGYAQAQRRAREVLRGDPPTCAATRVS